mgnify:CR=1 FL=1
MLVLDIIIVYSIKKTTKHTHIVFVYMCPLYYTYFAMR